MQEVPSSHAYAVVASLSSSVGEQTNAVSSSEPPWLPRPCGSAEKFDYT